MIKFVVGFVLGFVVATAGVGGIVGMADRGVNTAKETIKEAAPAPQAAVEPDLKSKWDAELKEASDLLKRK
jgi:hypothetical protein